VQKLLDDQGLAEEIGKNARETVISNFGLKSFVSRWENLFLACME
jgi:glycosyltransferase involved in cell wall biosynthesis